MFPKQLCPGLMSNYVPKLLDVVHRKIEETDLQFILTGSSARKLKKGAANLLAGRAFVFYLFPLTAAELGQDLSLQDALEYGTLPQITKYSNNSDKKRFLKAYGLTYLKEEVWGEQIVRKIEPFRKFLAVAAQTNGQTLNYRKIASDVGVDSATIKNYFTILEDTMVGFLLPAYHGSVRKQLKSAPKFYLFDSGIKRVLEDKIDFPLIHGSFEYGIEFESFIIREIIRNFAYKEVNVNMSFLATDGGAEVDLLISVGTTVKVLIEIKSATSYKTEHTKHLKSFLKDFKKATCFLLYGGDQALNDDGILVRPWQEGIIEILHHFGI
jgi:predicted AAA+ superfamily ATPase